MLLKEENDEGKSIFWDQSRFRFLENLILIASSLSVWISCNDTPHITIEKNQHIGDLLRKYYKEKDRDDMLYILMQNKVFVWIPDEDIDTEKKRFDLIYAAFVSIYPGYKHIKQGDKIESIKFEAEIETLIDDVIAYPIYRNDKRFEGRPRKHYPTEKSHTQTSDPQENKDNQDFYYSEKKIKLSPEQAIDQYKNYAIETMKKSWIPASVILAQFLLESGNGNSKLASYNNFFGIKCRKESCEQDTKQGMRETLHCIQRTDDTKNDRFLKFPSTQAWFDGYIDFLKIKNPRYFSIFEKDSKKFKEDTGDYTRDTEEKFPKIRKDCKQVAIDNRNNTTTRRCRALRAVGYATAPHYPLMLEQIIKRYSLSQYNEK